MPFLPFQAPFSIALLVALCFQLQVQAQSVTLPDNMYQQGEALKKIMGCPTNFCEGPAADAEGNVYFSAFGNPAQVWKVPASGTTPSDPFLANGETSNGIFVDAEDRVVVAQKNKITRFEKDGSSTVLVQGDNKFNFKNVNDLSMGLAGQMYFTNWDGGQVFYRSPEGEIKEVVNGLGHANGNFLIEEDSIIYVNDDANRSVYIYKVNANGDLSDRKKFAELPVPDGMTVDIKGNVYVASHTDKKVYVFEKSGKALGDIDLGPITQNITNVTFGGKDDKILYITSNSGLWAVNLKIPGRRLSVLKASTPVRRGVIHQQAFTTVFSLFIHNDPLQATSTSALNLLGRQGRKPSFGVFIAKP